MSSHPGPGELRLTGRQFLNLKAASFKFSSCSAGPKSRPRTWNWTVKFKGPGADYVTSLGPVNGSAPDWCRRMHTKPIYKLF